MTDRDALYFWLGRKAETVKIKPKREIYTIDPAEWIRLHMAVVK